MRLPPGNTLELFEGNGRVVVDAADHPAPSDAELLGLLPAWTRKGPSALRDVIVGATRRVVDFLWSRVGAYFGQLQTPRNAEGLGLDYHGRLRFRSRVAGEDEATYRARLLERPDIITPAALRGAVDALATPETSCLPVLWEPATDGIFVASEGAPWRAYVQGSAGGLDIRLWADYPDNSLERIGATLTPVEHVTLPVFWVSMPGDINSDEQVPFVGIPGMSPSRWSASDFVGTVGPPLVAWGFVMATRGSLVERVVREVEARRGGGVVWVLLVDPSMEAGR